MEFGDAWLGTDHEDDVDALDGSPGSAEMFDVDHDGYEETRVSHTDEGMTVSRDRDEDGVIDTFTAIGRGGHYETWEIIRVANGLSRWEQTSAGDTFG
ncbi:DUF6802 family protein [Rhodococcus sp. P1Y]|uniref:DUF6802 family protein n=1 Tax=Rhodococcus sp. P1Y TaxID=1302308 RepID=UPI000EAC975A|nr:DUF6802 family protein [Rhodococcus sp. P1Y]AYJ47947.1 hypothetical protein D8W71_05875 [Rhodococcus sp. P1Y]